MAERRNTFCRVCEPACGLVATVEDGKLVDLAPDRDHPVTKGFACQRGIAGLEIHHDPDRLNYPQRRLPDGSLQRATWDEAIADIAVRIRAISERHGAEALASYCGNPAAFNSITGAGMPRMLKKLGATRHFNAGTQDCYNKYAASAAVFGSTLLHPVPDLANAEVILLIGSNWRSSKASFFSVPNPYGLLMKAASRGARIWFVNPRRVESSDARTGPTIQVKPDTDVYFLAALLCEIERTVGFDPVVEQRGRNVEGLRAFVRRYPPERVAEVCGIDAAVIREVAFAFATSGRSAVHMSTGANMGRQGALAYWLVHQLSFVTGNLDRQGGNVAAPAFYRNTEVGRMDFGAAREQTEFGERFAADTPGGLLADYITQAEHPIRAMWVTAGNPVLSVPGATSLHEAMASLELLVCLDIYPSATSELAHWLLPATDQFERPDLNLAAIGIQHEPAAQWTEAVVDPQFERRPEWWVYARVEQALGIRSALDADDPEAVIWRGVDHLLDQGGLSRRQLREAPDGVVRFSKGLEAGTLFETAIQTPDKRVDCCPDAFDSALGRCDDIFAELAGEPPGTLKLICGRHARWQNSWYANVPGMKRSGHDRNRLGMNPDDAAARGLEDGSLVEVRSQWGAITVDVRIDDTLRPGVVWLEHGWGLQPGLRLSRAMPGANVNVVLPHGPESFDRLSNQQHLTGVPVEVTAAVPAS
ncbi:MAG TPA: molybdopterin-dependent oxidoreductase [Acidimicrobiales bacterium]|nr:molybdopterin-dependent oxidoreductase [Acidimicrobiales bacterium]